MLTFSPQMKARVDQLAQSEGATMNEVVRRAIAHYFWFLDKTELQITAKVPKNETKETL